MEPDYQTFGSCMQKVVFTQTDVDAAMWYISQAV
jgi:hypothetical protein